MTRFTILTILMTSLIISCSGTQGRGSDRPDALEGGSEESDREARELRGSCERGEREVTYDLNHDDATDIREVYDGDTLVCRETDLNFDGRIDVYRYYVNGNQRREEMDLDRDGRLDLVTVFDGSGRNTLREEYDTNYDARIDVWRHFSGNNIQRIERDSDHDGRADVWTHCSSGRAVRLEYDTDGDGEPDESQNVSDDETSSECSRGALAESESEPAPSNQSSGDEEG